MCLSDGPATSLMSTAQHTITSLVAPIRPVSKPASRISAQRACGMATGVCMFCSNVMAGPSIKRKYEGFTMNWAFSYVTRHPSGVSKRSCVMTVCRRRDQTISGLWILSMTNSLRGVNKHWFMTLDDARQKLENWRNDYNTERPHGAIGNKPPILLQNPGGVTSPQP